VARTIRFAAILVVLCPSSLFAQEWAEKMFKVLKHDFGTVARGADVEHRFEVQNIYEETVHIASVRTSCGCTSPTLENQTIQTWGKGYVVAKFNTRTFRGQHGATLTVTIDKPFPAEVQLRVEGNIRGDVVFHPGAIRFANVDQGSEHEQKVRVSYAGRSDWKIELIVVTSDRNNSRIPLDVEGTIVPEISVSPNQLVLGEVEQGAEVTKRLVVKGKNPFRITSVECENDSFTFEAGDEAKSVHIITVKFRADRDPGKVQEAIRIVTDRGEKIQATLDAYAEIVSPVKSQAPETGETEEPATEQQAAVGS
jgi:hypothetical protein